jgi:hypothetical protein
VNFNNFPFNGLDNYALQLSISKYINLLNQDKLQIYLNKYLNKGNTKFILKTYERFFLYYIFNLLNYKNVKFSNKKKLEKLFYKFQSYYLITPNTYENILLRIIALKGLLVVSSNKEFILELKFDKNIKKLISDYQTLKEKKLLTEFDIHICDNILKDLHKI